MFLYQCEQKGNIINIKNILVIKVKIASCLLEFLRERKIFIEDSGGFLF